MESVSWAAPQGRGREVNPEGRWWSRMPGVPWLLRLGLSLLGSKWDFDSLLRGSEALRNWWSLKEVHTDREARVPIQRGGCSIGKLGPRPQFELHRWAAPMISQTVDHLLPVFDVNSDALQLSALQFNLFGVFYSMIEEILHLNKCFLQSGFPL